MPVKRVKLQKNPGISKEIPGFCFGGEGGI